MRQLIRFLAILLSIPVGLFLLAALMMLAAFFFISCAVLGLSGC